MLCSIPHGIQCIESTSLSIQAALAAVFCDLHSQKKKLALNRNKYGSDCGAFHDFIRDRINRMHCKSQMSNATNPMKKLELSKKISAAIANIIVSIITIRTTTRTQPSYWCSTEERLEWLCLYTVPMQLKIRLLGSCYFHRISHITYHRKCTKRLK